MLSYQYTKDHKIHRGYISGSAFKNWLQCFYMSWKLNVGTNEQLNIIKEKMEKKYKVSLINIVT